MEFLVVDSRSTYHGVLRKPTLKELWDVTLIHHLCMKFPTELDIATARDDQMSIKEHYLNSFRKAKPRDVNVILMDIDVNNVSKQG